MATKTFTQHISPLLSEVTFEDDELATGGIVINEDAYNTAFDRDYDVRGLSKIGVIIEETAGVNGITFKIQEAFKSFDLIADLVDADYQDGFVAETPVAANAENGQEVIVKRQVTAIRLRVKRTGAGLNGTLAGNIRGK